MKRLNVDRARALRRGQSDAERRLWERLRHRVLLGWKFRRQHEIGPFVVDFACADAGLVVELDGGQHLDQTERDARRTRWLEQEGYRVLRFWNDDVLKRTDEVLEQIVRALPDTPPHPNPLPGGERGKCGEVSLSGSCGNFVPEQVVGALPDMAPHPAAQSVLRVPPAHPCAGPQPLDSGFDPLLGGERGKDVAASSKLSGGEKEDGGVVLSRRSGGKGGERLPLANPSGRDGDPASPPLPSGERVGVRGRPSSARATKP